MINNTTPLKLLRQKYRERMNELADTVSTGECKSYEDYKFLCGQIQGLAYAERELLDLAEQMERNND